MSSGEKSYSRKLSFLQHNDTNLLILIHFRARLSQYAPKTHVIPAVPVDSLQERHPIECYTVYVAMVTELSWDWREGKKL